MCSKYLRLILNFLEILNRVARIFTIRKILAILAQKRLRRRYRLCIQTRRASFCSPTFFLLCFQPAVVCDRRAGRGTHIIEIAVLLSHASGATTSARIIRRYYRVPVVHPDAKVDSRLDARLCRAATIAQERANARSKSRCWRYVKEALLASGVIDSYPKSNYAWQAGEELERDFGFTRLPIRDQFAAPIGSVLVFGHGAESHVVIRTRTGFASDYWTKNRCKYPLIAVYAKPSS